MRGNYYLLRRQLVPSSSTEAANMFNVKMVKKKKRDEQRNINCVNSGDYDKRFRTVCSFALYTHANPFSAAYITGGR